jgi:hypothetical protein
MSICKFCKCYVDYHMIVYILLIRLNKCHVNCDIVLIVLITLSDDCHFIIVANCDLSYFI